MTLEEFPGKKRVTFEEPKARHTDPETSHGAAELAKFKASPHRKACLFALSRGPKTDFELAAATGIQQTSIGKRRHECMEAGLVRRAGIHESLAPVRRKTPSGAWALVWEITPEGIEYLKGLA